MANNKADWAGRLARKSDLVIAHHIQQAWRKVRQGNPRSNENKSSEGNK
jgi:hypothetical protein